jgi:tetratricopeptide (TPR) repeat protein
MSVESLIQKHTNLLEEEIEKFICMKGELFIRPTPLSSTEDQFKKLRVEMLSILTRDYIKDDLLKALILIRDNLKEIIDHDQYEQVKREFLQSEKYYINVIDDYEEMESVELLTHSFSKMFGLSEQTLKHILHLIIDLYHRKNYENAKSVAIFLYVVAFRNIEGGLALGRCLEQLGQQYEAIAVYKSIQENFPENPAAYILCAKVFLKLGDALEAKMLIKDAETKLRENTKLQALWMPHVAEFKKKL